MTLEGHLIKHCALTGLCTASCLHSFPVGFRVFPDTLNVFYKELADQWCVKREEILNITHRVFPSETMDVRLNCMSAMKSPLRNIISLSVFTKQGKLTISY